MLVASLSDVRNGMTRSTQNTLCVSMGREVYLPMCLSLEMDPSNTRETYAME